MCSYVIETKRLTKKYGEQTAVNAVNIHVEKGRIYGSRCTQQDRKMEETA